jgi:hypothetical protein
MTAPRARRLSLIPGAALALPVRRRRADDARVQAKRPLRRSTAAAGKERGGGAGVLAI